MGFTYEYDEARSRLKINLQGQVLATTLEDSEEAMSDAIERLIEVKKVETLSLIGDREYEYDSSQTEMLSEIAFIVEELSTNIISKTNILNGVCKTCMPQRFAEIQDIVINTLRKDPIGAYVKARRIFRILKKHAETDEKHKQCHVFYLQNVLYKILEDLGNTKLIRAAAPYIAGYKYGDRSVYRKILHPTIKPNFMSTRFMTIPPAKSEPMQRYKVQEVDVEIFKVPGKVRNVYHITPPEFNLSEEHYQIIDTARRYMSEHKPKDEEFTRLDKIRDIFFNISRDMVRNVAKSMNINLSSEEVTNLGRILTRYTAGLGILEILLADEKIQDIYINSPIGSQPIYIYHADFEDCETNIIPTQEDAEIWATRFRISSGRPLDEANPVLDTEVNVPGGRARVSVITRSLSPDGLGYALRRHRDDPWTYPLLMKYKMMNPLAAGLMWFLVDGSRTMLFAGTRSAGKTSVLGATMAEIMKRYRIITVEDSVTGDSEIIYEINGKIEKGTVGRLIDNIIESNECYQDEFGRQVIRDNKENVKVFSIDNEGKVKLSPVSAFIRHMTDKPIYEITTRTGRKIKVTGDHSLFTLSINGEIEPIKTNELKVGDHIATPRILPLECDKVAQIDILENLNNLGGGFLSGSGLEKFFEDNYEKIKRLVRNRSKRSRWKREMYIPVKFIQKFFKDYKFTGQEIYYETRRSKTKIPRFINLTDNFIKLLGLWLADGSYDKNAVIISVVDENERNCVRETAKELGVDIRMHSDKISLMLCSVTVKNLLKSLGFVGDAYTKRIPSWIFNLNKDQKKMFLQGLFSGDGCVGDKEISMSLSSLGLLKDTQTLLLEFGIILRIGGFREKDRTYNSRISSLASLKKFSEIGFLQDYKNANLENLTRKESTHDSTDIIPFSSELKEILCRNHRSLNYNDYVKRDNNIGRQKLMSLTHSVPDMQIAENIRILANADIYWDEVKEIRLLDQERQFVYDFSVPQHENFICENILAHNTLELPIEKLRAIGYNIQKMKSRSVITHVETELAADEALRTALRLGDSALVIGEVRSVEAKALYEAMRIGALANVVAGTIHGDSPYGVFDRVVNDLQVPATSFKATDIIVVANRLKSADGLKSFRRITGITEVRKHWKSDPQDEGGFVPLMEYSAKKDTLVPTQTLLAGESHILNDIASNVREWSGNWEAVWENIELRTRIKETLLDIATKTNTPELLEAKFSTLSNDQFYFISEIVKNEVGSMDTNMVYDKWYEWVKDVIKKRV